MKLLKSIDKKEVCYERNNTDCFQYCLSTDQAIIDEL